MKQISLQILLILFVQNFTYSQSFFRQPVKATDFRDITLHQAMQSLQRKSQDADKLKQGFNYVFSAKASKHIDKKITLSLNEIPLFEAIKYTLMTLKMEAKFELKTVIILAPGEKYKSPVIQEKFVKRDPRLLSALKLRCKEIDAENLSFKEVLKLIKNQSVESDKNKKGINLLDISGASSKKLTLKLKNLSVYEALRYSSIAANVSMKIDRSAIVLQKR